MIPYEKEQCVLCKGDLTFDSEMNIICAKCGEKQPLDPTDNKAFYRKNGLPCPACGSKKEYLHIVGNAIYLVCSDCEQNKGKEPFRPFSIKLHKIHERQKWKTDESLKSKTKF